MSGLRPQTNSFVVSVGSRDQQERGMGVGTRETAYAVVDVHILTSRDVIEDFEILFSGRCVRQPGRAPRPAYAAIRNTSSAATLWCPRGWPP